MQLTAARMGPNFPRNNNRNVFLKKNPQLFFFFHQACHSLLILHYLSTGLINTQKQVNCKFHKTESSFFFRGEIPRRKHGKIGESADCRLQKKNFKTSVSCIFLKEARPDCTAKIFGPSDNEYYAGIAFTWYVGAWQKKNLNVFLVIYNWPVCVC